jgi:sugar phosphate isomerase/epimerase
MSLGELAAWAKCHDFDCLEVAVGARGHLDPAEVLSVEGHRVSRIVEEHGISISSLASMLNLLDPDPQVREDRIRYLRLTIDAASQLAVPVVVTYAGSAFGPFFYGLPGVPWGHPSNRVGNNLSLFSQIYGPLASYAEDRGVRIAFETAPRGGGHGNLAHSPQLWEMMFEALPSLALGLSFDPSHLVWLHIPNIPQLIHEFRSRIFHVDGKDTEILPCALGRQGIWGNGWWRYRIPGMGQLDWRELIHALDDIGYQGSIDIENEDELRPGLPGCKLAGRHLRDILSERKSMPR